MRRFLAFFFLLLLVACGDDSSVREVNGFDEVESEWRKREASLEDLLVQGKFVLAKDLTPVGIALAVLDDTLGVVKEIEGNVFDYGYDRYDFPRRDYETSYVRFTYSCETSSSDTVEFVEYVDLRWYDWPDLDIWSAFLRYRVEHLVVKEHYPLFLAKRQASKNLLDYLSVEYEDFPYDWGEKRFKEDFWLSGSLLPRATVENFDEQAREFSDKFANEDSAGGVE